MVKAYVRPAKANNAIDVAALTVAFDQMLTPDEMLAARQAIDGFSVDLPGVMLEQPGITFHFGPSDMPPPAPPYGRYEAARDGTHSWRVQIFPNLLQVLCADYTHSSPVLEKMNRFAQGILATLPQRVRIIELGLSVQDKFLYDMAPEDAEYTTDAVFAANTRYLTQVVRSSGALWHVHQGWFKELNETSRFLNQLNLSNVELSETSMATLIDHRCLLQFKQETAPGYVALREQLNQLITLMLKTNKAIIRELLTSEMLKAIGMKESQ